METNKEIRSAFAFTGWQLTILLVASLLLTSCLSQNSEQSTSSRLPSLTLEELLPEEHNRIGLLENRYFLAYFPSIEEIPSDTDYLFIDLSFSGQLKVLDKILLDEKSWGFYVKEVKLSTDYNFIEEDPYNYQALSSTLFTLLMLHHVQHEVDRERAIISLENKDLQIVWGPLKYGTAFYLPQHSFELLKEFGAITDVYIFIPKDDPDFSCEYLSEDPVWPGMSMPGYICTYINQD